MKTKEEMNALNEKVETENRQRRALTDEETEQVAGGTGPTPDTPDTPDGYFSRTTPTGDENITQQ